MNPSTLSPQANPDPSPTQSQPTQTGITSTQINTIGFTIGLIFLIGIMSMSLISSLVGGGFALRLLDHTETASAAATVTHVSASAYPNGNSNTGSDISCGISYSFEVEGKTYIGNTSTSSDTNCDHYTGSTQTVHYNPKDPSHNTIESKTGAYVGLVFFIVGLLTLLISLAGLFRLQIAIKHRRTATSAQMELIANGFQELGDYWEPKRMTQTEAEQMIADLDRRLALQRHQA